jgi:hypothetical protein
VCRFGTESTGRFLKLEGLEKIFANTTARDVTLLYEGVELKLKVRDLSWNERTAILTESFKYDEKGMKFDFASYMKSTLSKIIVSAPWGETNQIFFTKITAPFGMLLETLVPKAFAEGQQPADFFAPEQ